MFNIELPRTTYYQCEVGVEVPFEELLPGDLLFFADGGDVHHVAMYLGEGRFVHSTGHTGTEGVILSSLAEEAPDYRADLKESMTAVASIFGAPQ